MAPKILLFLCFAIALRPGYCESKNSGNDEDERARLPEFITELDLASLEASEEDIEALKTVVKRLAPEKNGEYQVYQGVMGQPGVDFPALTNIPTTTFSCRGLKGGYYADLETNCQVFHICDNGRKISFLCPNGTIFQQSQLICDWWFKVDCSKSAELYEQSAEQLASEERKRSEAKRMNSEFHRASSENDDNNGQKNYYQSSSSNYDGRQNGRTNPFGQTSVKNPAVGNAVQRGSSGDFKTSTRGYDPNQIYSSNSVAPNQSNQINDLAAGNTVKSLPDALNSVQNIDIQKNRQQQDRQSSVRTTLERGNYRTNDRQQNQLIDATNDEVKRQYNYEQRGSNKFSNQNTYGNNNRRDSDREDRRNPVKSGNYDHEQSSNRVTPSYTETTTFRTSTASPIKEYQQLAESAAFATNRGNRYNEAHSSSQFNAYYNKNFNANDDDSNENSKSSRSRQQSTERPRQKSITPTPQSDKNASKNYSRVRVASPLPFPTFQPIYKPRRGNSNSQNDYETTLSSTDSLTTLAPDYNDNFDYGTTTSYPTIRDSDVTTQTWNTEVTTEDYPRDASTSRNERADSTSPSYFENTTPTIITSGTYVNAKTYSVNKATSYKSSLGSSGFTTARTSSKSTNPSNQSTVGHSESRYSTTVPIDRDSSRTDENRQQSRGKSNTRATGQNVYRGTQNFISSSTEKSSRSLSTFGQGQTGFTVKTLSPYDTSFTYQQGKVMSTLGPYIPFTKNYAYSTTTTTTTSKPSVYTATSPTYSTAGNRASVSKSASGKFKLSSTASPIGKVESGGGAYLPERKIGLSQSTRKNSLSERPLDEREHAMSMIKSLRGLEGTVPSILVTPNSSRSGLNPPTSSGPSTLHSLALYFATASDDFDITAESRMDPAAQTESTKSREEDSSKSAENSGSVELPTSILTQHTINSYAELFNLNNALEGNSSIETSLDDFTDEREVSNEDNDDLDLQQSEGPVAGVRKSNSTRLRELAQVFTHALSAYLQDPDTFKKILTEIRPTDPSTIDDGGFTVTTSAPTTADDYPSVTKEKDEVLDFSDDSAPIRGRRPTTIYPITTTDSPFTTETYRPDYYTTSVDYWTTSRDESNERPDNDFAFEVNHAFGTSANANELNSGNGGGIYYPEEASGPSDTRNLDDNSNNDPLSDYRDNYFPNDDNGANKIGGFQNNSQSSSTHEPYGKYVKPFDATPISDNYVSSSTPSSWIQTSDKPIAQKFTGSNSNQRYNGLSTPDSTRISANSANKADNKKPNEWRNANSPKSTTEPFRIRYYDSTSPKTRDRESLVTAGSVYSKYHENSNDLGSKNYAAEKSNYVTSVVTSRTIEPNHKATGFNGGTHNHEGSTTPFSDNRQNDRKQNDHWTSSPVVTQLWESTVFVDPKRINQGLVAGTPKDTNFESTTYDYGETTSNPAYFNGGASNRYNNRDEGLVTDATSSGLTSRNPNNLEYPSSPWKWSTVNDNDSPTAFTLLPHTERSYEQSLSTATPSPVYTTLSSITTTITSSVTSTSADPGIALNKNVVAVDSSAKRPKHAISGRNESDNEISRAQEMFGKLNTTSTNTLMRVMKQADTNSTVRQLVLLLISHCKGPMNKTMEEEKEQLLDALLRMPVNEFTSEESRQLVAGINRLNLPIGKPSIASTVPSTSTTTTDEPVVTTFRSKKGRRFKSSAIDLEENIDDSKNDDIVTAETGNYKNALTSEEASDARALELLRSLYTIAAKWG